MEEDTDPIKTMYIEPEDFIPDEKMSEFTEELRTAINKCSVERYCNTPDFILAGMLAGTFEMYCLTKNLSNRYSMNTINNKEN